MFFCCRLRCLIIAACVLLASCSGITPQGMPGVEFAGAANYSERRPVMVVLHHTGSQSFDHALNTLTTSRHQVSAHYLVGRNGRVVQMVDERHRAWHAGVSSWKGIHDVNSVSIGIELDNDGSEPFAPAQINALLELLADIRQRHQIPAANFVGHADVAPGRKVDPGVRFPWATLAEHGFGLWCKPPIPEAPAGFDLLQGLAGLGYDPAKPEAVRKAFLQHFAGGSPLSERQQKALAYCLIREAG